MKNNAETFSQLCMVSAFLKYGAGKSYKRNFQVQRKNDLTHVVSLPEELSNDIRDNYGTN